MGIVDQLLALGHLGPEARREIEYELALACCTRVYTGRIHWRLHFPWLRECLSEAQNHRCCWCGIRMLATIGNGKPTFEHAIPLSAGGRDAPDNLAVACWGCNSRRIGEYAPSYSISTLH